MSWPSGTGTEKADQIASASTSSMMRSKRDWIKGVMRAPKIPGRMPDWKAGRSVMREGRKDDQSSAEGAVGLEGVARGRGREGPIQIRPLHVERMSADAVYARSISPQAMLLPIMTMLGREKEVMTETVSAAKMS